MNPNHKLGNPLPQKVAVVRSLPGLGDFLCIVPALRALRTALPEAEIALVGLPQVRDLVARFEEYIDRLIEFSGYPGIPEGWHSPRKLPAFLEQMHRQNFNLALQLHGSGIISNSFTVLLGATYNAGLFLPGQYCPDPERFLPLREQQSEVQRYLQLMEFLGIPIQGEALEFPILESDWEQLQQIPEIKALTPGEYACIHPGASVCDRCWSPLQFACLGDTLSKWGLKIILTGTRKELQLTQTIAKAMHAPVVNLAGKTRLGSLAALLKGAQLLVCNDTGISHLAAALSLKSVVIFSTSDPRRWAPLNHQLHRVVTRQPTRPRQTADRTNFPVCDLPTPDERVLETVLIQAKNLLNLEVNYAI